MLRKLALLSVVLLLAGCFARGAAFQPAPQEAGKALVYVYRVSSFVAGARDAYFYVGDKNVVDLSAGGYSYFYVDPGDHVVSQRWAADVVLQSLRVPLKASAGGVYYYQFFVGESTGPECQPNVPCFEFQLKQVTESEAKPELAKTRFQRAR